MEKKEISVSSSFLTKNFAVIESVSNIDTKWSKTTFLFCKFCR